MTILVACALAALISWGIAVHQRNVELERQRREREIALYNERKAELAEAVEKLNNFDDVAPLYKEIGFLIKTNLGTGSIDPNELLATENLLIDRLEKNEMALCGISLE